jgi:Flp pilus assembly protein TadG
MQNSKRSSFRSDQSGNFAIMSAILAMPMILAVGAAIDLTRHHSAQTHLQDIADSASLAMAISREQSSPALRRVGEESIAANLNQSALRQIAIERIETNEQEIDLVLTGELKTTFMGIAGYHTMPVRAASLAKREATGTVEVALVLDNTYSMIGPGTSGQKIASLKGAASQLVETLMRDNEDGAIRIGLVPYADYVNVGVQHRNASWLAINPRNQPTCREIREETFCREHAPRYSCTTTVDGIEKPATCGGECRRQETVYYDPPRQSCSGEDKREWHGCVGSRIGGGAQPYRVHDGNPWVTYPGLIDGVQKCPTPITPLTDNKRRLLDALREMAVERPYHQPLTYIPSGLIWGQNVLSASAPFSEGADYDPKNRRPRKIMILMTDGANTMMVHTNSGHHGNVRGGAKEDRELSSNDLQARRKEQKQTNDDSLAICDYMKSKNTEIYTVAFMVDTDAGKALMRDCASSERHYYDAVDQTKLNAAFEAIADSISRVRLAR